MSATSWRSVSGALALRPDRPHPAEAPVLRAQDAAEALADDARPDDPDRVAGRHALGDPLDEPVEPLLALVLDEVVGRTATPVADLRIVPDMPGRAVCGGTSEVMRSMVAEPAQRTMIASSESIQTRVAGVSLRAASRSVASISGPPRSGSA